MILKHLQWPPCHAQINQKTMYQLRESIRGGASIQCTLVELSESMTSEALLAKDPHDGRNLLVYAASCGRADWFIHLTKRIAKECGVRALVKELRELDVDGASLLFLAASSRTTSTCFVEVFQVLRAFLGMAGLLEQIEADDHYGQNIMMYAARGKHADTFACARDLYKDAFIRRQQETWQETPIQPESSKDANGSNTFQHAEACCIPAGLPIVKGVWGLCPSKNRKTRNGSDADDEVDHGSAGNRHITNAVEGVNGDFHGNHARTKDNSDVTPVQQANRRSPPHSPSIGPTRRPTGAWCRCCNSTQVLKAVRDACRLSPERTRARSESDNRNIYASAESHVATICACCNPLRTAAQTRSPRQMMIQREKWEREVERFAEKWCDRIQKVDHRGKTILHHAAEAASLDVFALVFKMAREDGIDVHDRMALPDMNERTPIMLFLRNKYGSCDGCEGDASTKMYRLWLHAPKEGWMQQRMVPPVWKLTGNDQMEENGEEFITLARTELFHAACGGPTRLDLTLEYIKKQQKRLSTPNSDEVHLDKVLGMAIWSTKPPHREGQQALRHEVREFLKTPDVRERLARSPRATAASEEELRKTVRHWGYGMLLAAAVKGGHEKVIKRVVSAIEVGRFLDETETWGGERDSGAVVSAINAIKDSGRSLFALAIMSGKPGAAKFVYRNIMLRYFPDQPNEVWNLLCGPQVEKSPLTFAASAPMTAERNGVDMLHTVYYCLRQAARGCLGQARGDDEMLELLRFRSAVKRAGRSSDSGSDMFTAKAITPLGAAALRSNWVLFRLLYNLYETLRQGRWSREEILNQLPDTPPRAFSIEKNQAMHEFRDDVDASLRSGAEGLSAVMWHDIVQAYQRATPEKPGDVKDDLPSWRGHFRDYSRRAVEVAVETMFFDDLRELVKEGFPLHDEQIPCLLENIEDHEQDVIDIVMYAVGNARVRTAKVALTLGGLRALFARYLGFCTNWNGNFGVWATFSNPLVMAAGVSKNVKTAEANNPMHRIGLRRLQKIVDEVTNELLDNLPHTVRGMGLTLLRPIVPEGRLSQIQQRRRNVLANLAGFIAVEWMLEPQLLVGKATDKRRYNGPNYVNPLQRAVDRGSEALQFVNKPLVLDYLHVKFSCGLPHWVSRKPDLASINEGFYTFYDFDRYAFSMLSGKRSNSLKDKSVSPEAWDTFLLRFLQGWNPGRDDTTFDVQHDLEKEKNGARLKKSYGPDKSEGPDWNDFPRSTILPGLQFLLAGIIGKPETFYEVPAMLFTFGLISYLMMLALFCSCVILEESDRISKREWAFYFFVAGLVWREILEFLDGMPSRQFRRGRKERRSAPPRGHSTLGSSIKRSGGGKPGGKDLSRMVAGFGRYILHDTWNLLDVLSIVFVLVAFIFRLRGLTRYGGPSNPGDDFFMAQFFLAWSAPLLFPRLLLLSQIDGTLGPMVQILGRLMSQTVRFSAFIIVMLTSFALAFHAVFATCDEGSDLHENFGTFPAALISVFGAGLGEFGSMLESFADAEEHCPENPAPRLLKSVGVALFMAYLVVMTVVLLNLLIAVLSSEHQKVSAKGEMEFHLARARLILQNSLAVTNRRIPAPFNLILVGIGLLFDGAQECLWQYKKYKKNIARCPSFPAFCFQARPTEVPVQEANGLDGQTRCTEDVLPQQGFRRYGVSSQASQISDSQRRANLAQGSPPPHKKIIQSGERTNFIPATSTYWWFTFEGFLQRGAFALTMGVTALALSALLWIISLPWVAWSLLRWFRRWDQPRGGEGEESSMNERQGHLRTLVFALLGACAWIIALGFAAVMCALCCIGSIILWGRGLWGVAEWSCWRFTAEGRAVSGEAESTCPTAMPGQERGDHWRHAWSVVQARNYRIRQESGSVHFHVAPLLKSTKGLDIERLMISVKERDTNINGNRELRYMDKEAAEALFSPQMQYVETSPRASAVTDDCPWSDDSGIGETKRSTS